MSNSSFSMDDYDNISNYRVTQASHGFAVGDVLRTAGAGVYAKAQADSDANAEVVGIVSTVIDANTFRLRVIGRQTGLAGLVADSVYFLSHVTPGALSLTDPATISSGFVSKPVLLTDTTTSGVILTYRGINDGGGAGAGGFDLTNLNDVTITSPADGEHLVYNSGTSQWENQVAAGGGGVWSFVSSATLSASSSADFTGLDLTANAEYMFIINEVVLSTNSSLGFRVSVDNGSNYLTGTYATMFHRINEGGSGVSGVDSGTYLKITPVDHIALSNYGISARLNIACGSNANTDLRAYCTTASAETNGNHIHSTLGHYADSNFSQVNAIRILPTAGTMTSGTIYLYKLSQS